MQKTSALLLIVFAGIAAFGVYSYLGYKEVADQSGYFVGNSLEAFSGTWDPKIFVKRADPGLVQAMNGKGQGVEQIFAVWRTLGKLKKPANCDLMNTATLTVGSERYAAATYHCAAEYDAGPAKIAITVRKGDTKRAWEIYYMKIESEYFAPVPKL